MPVLASVLITLAFAVDGHELFAFEDARINESSNIVFSGDLAYTTNDSGDGPHVYVIDPGTGRTVGVATYDGDAVDVEALAIGPDETMWVADIGDNRAVRTTVTVHAMDVPGRGDQTVRSTAYDLVYEDGPRDAETLLVHPVTGRLYVVTKGLLAGSVYEAPEHLSASEPNLLTRVGRVGGLITDGVFLPEGDHILLRDYSRGVVLDASYQHVATFRLPGQQQGEGITWHDDQVVLSSEGEHAPVLGMALPEDVVTALEGGPSPTLPTEVAEPESEPTPQPAEETFLMRLVPWALGAGWLGLLGFVLVSWRGRGARRDRRSGGPSDQSRSTT